MGRLSYTQMLLTGYLAILFTLKAAVHAHMIDVNAGKKECFFEDLNKNDKVRLSSSALLILFLIGEICR